MDVGALIYLAGGLFALGVGIRQALRIPLRRRSGVHSPGTVVRVRQEWDADENVWLSAPVVTFRDEHGTERELTPGTVTTWQTHQRGDQVTVSYPAGRPEAARLQSGAHSAMWFVTAGLSAVFIVVGLLLLGSFVRNLP